MSTTNKMTELLQMKMRHSGYNNNPESHPKYREEWGFFWQGLLDRGIHFQDVSKYIPFWIPFWMKRMGQLQMEEKKDFVNSLSNDEKKSLLDLLRNVKEN